MHPFVGPFVVLALLTMAMVAVGAWWRLGIGRDKPLAAHVLAVWALVVLLANLANVLGLGAWTSGGLVVFGVAAASVGLGAPLTSCWKGILRQWPQVGFLFLVIAGQVVVYLVPLIAVFPDETLITGNFVCNDSVAHAVMMRGRDAMEHRFGYWEYLRHYPSGIHGVVRLLTPLMPAGGMPYVLLPVSIWVSSWLGFAVWLLLASEREPQSASSLLVAVSPAAALLLGTSVYLFFISHMGALPFVLAATVMLTSWSSSDVRGKAVVLIALPVAASMAVYGLISGSVLVLALILRTLTALRRRGVKALSAEARKISWPEIAVASGVFVLLLPVLSDILQGFVSFAGRTGTRGNLPGGFLSPFHVTGLWLGGGDYRDQLAGSALPMVLAAVLALQVWLVVRARLSVGTLQTLVTFVVPVVATAMLLDSPYINFKYLCLLTAVWVPLVTLGVKRLVSSRAFDPRGRAAAWFLLVIVVLLVSAPLRSYSHLPPLPVHWFNVLDVIQANHFAKGPVLVLSREDWFHYYRGDEDIVPLTTYFPQEYDRQPMREVLLDDAFRTEGEAFLAERMPGALQRLDAQCAATVVGGRFRLYDFACLAGIETAP